MSTNPILQTLDILSREKGIDPGVIISAIEDAVVTAARKHFKTGEDLHARYNPENGDVELFALMRVVETVENPATELSVAAVEGMGIEGAEVGDQLEFPKSREELGRIAAQTAKQIIYQKVREAERNNVYDEYIGRLGELVHGFVKRFEGGGIIVDLGKVEAVLPKSEQSRAESFSQGERIRIVINQVSKEAKGPQVELSRTSPELLKRLFEMEVPEIYDGTVQIKEVAREPGDRAKIAVISTERDVDPVGACVGMKGSRVQAIIRELRGERIDIIEWSEDPAVFAANALSPAKVLKVEINSFEEKRLTVTVAENQVPLAFGKKGENVALAAKLVGWHIEIRTREEDARAAAAQPESLFRDVATLKVSGVKASKAGITLVQSIPSSLTPDYLATVVTPYLRAIAELQHIIDEIVGRERQDVSILSVVQKSPIEINLKGGAEAIQAIKDTIVPWRRQHLEQMAHLQVQQRKTEIEIKKTEILERKSQAAKTDAEAEKIASEVEQQRQQTERMRLENEKLRLELHRAKIELGLDILSLVAPNLTETDRIAYVVKLLPPIDVLVFSELEIADLKPE